MATISEKIDKILDEKIQKIRPENIANGIQIFEVIGNANITVNEVTKSIDSNTLTSNISAETDKQELVDAVLNALPFSEGVDI